MMAPNPQLKQLHTTDAVTASIAGIDLNNAGYIIVALFVTVWLCAIGYWHLVGVDNRMLPGRVVDARLASDTPAARG